MLKAPPFFLYNIYSVNVGFKGNINTLALIYVNYINIKVYKMYKIFS